MTVRTGGSWKNSGLPMALLVPMLGPVSGTVLMAWLKCRQAATTVSRLAGPKSRAAIAPSRSSSGGASVQADQARNSAMKLGPNPLLQLSSVPLTLNFSSALYRLYHW